MRIVLWDIDGTLVDTGGVGSRALARVVSRSPSAAEALRRMRLGGMTDRKIARILCAADAHHHRPEAGLPELEKEVTDEQIDAVLAGYLDALRESITGAERYRVLPGVVDVLDALRSDRIVHALGTGNVEEGARLKLARGGLWERFAFGGFGSDAEDRTDILRAAWRKAEAHMGTRLGPEAFVVVGDTPRDIHAAHALGIACVAVATGSHTANELAQNGADMVFSSLAELGAAERIVTVVR